MMEAVVREWQEVPGVTVPERGYTPLVDATRRRYRHRRHDDKYRDESRLRRAS